MGCRSSHHMEWSCGSRWKSSLFPLPINLALSIRAALWWALECNETSAWVFSPSALRLIHQMPCLGFLGTAIKSEMLTDVVIDRNGHSSLNRYMLHHV